MFAYNTQVTTDSGIKHIANLQIGDRILTHAGRFKPVSSIMRRSYSDRLIRIKAKCIGTPLEITPASLVLTSNGWMKASTVRAGDKLAIGVPRNVYPPPRFDLAETVYASDLEVEITPQTIRVRRPASYQNSGLQSRWVHRFLEVTPDLALLCGYYISAGSIDPGERCVRFTFAKDETDYHNDIARLMEKLFGIAVGTVASNQGGWITINVYSRVIARWLCDQFGRGATSKRLPVWLQFAEPNIQTAFLVGVMRGDGLYSEATYTVAGRKSPKVFRNLRLTLSNPGLIQQIWHMCLRLGYDAAIRSVDTTYVTQNASPTSQISMPPLQSRALVYKAFGISLPEADNRFIRPSILRIDGMVYFEIGNIEIEKYEGDIYNCIVEEDLSCTVAGVVTQNYLGFSPTTTLCDANEPLIHQGSAHFP